MSRTTVARTCFCGKAFSVQPNVVKKGKGKFCSLPCANAHRKQPAATRPAKFGREHTTVITPKAADRTPRMGDLGRSGMVDCARCRQPRPRGEFCPRCEYKAFEGMAS